jgi:phosphoribosyl 1,2-cyclic phosphate phosphodiesterase
LKITFLGTGTSQGVPVIACECRVCKSASEKDKRLRSSVLLEENGTTIIIDTGPDFREQMLRANVKQVDAILITHAHKDHLGGLDDVRAYNYRQRSPVDVYARNEVQEAIKREFSYAFAKNRYPGVPQITLHTLYNQPVYIQKLQIIPVEVMHYRLHVLGFRIDGFSYITDANFISEEEKVKLTGTKTLVVNALRREKHISHFSLDEALALIEEIKPQRAYLTHISHLMGLHDEVEKDLPANVRLAYDGLQIVI